MKELRVSCLNGTGHTGDVKEVASYLNKAEKHPLSFAPWAAFPYKPEVYFSVAYGAGNLYLQYTVREHHLLAAHGRTNAPVYEDSCTEFFVLFADDASYYNFEFNCIGTVLAGYGKGRNERTLLTEETLQKINRQVLIQKTKESSMPHWELTVVLPLEVFLFHSFSSLQGTQCRANFYKCGDNLPEPHFLTWANIESNEPDFHLPRFFGTLRFD